MTTRSKTISEWQQVILILFITSAVRISALNCSSDPCMYGICLDNTNRSYAVGQINTYSCYCIDGYTGINCEINWDDCWSNPCSNGGTCNDGVASYNCTCPDGFIGSNCEESFSECMNEPCLNNGTCIDHNGITCQCLDGYSGNYCEIDAVVCNNTVCKNSGECIDGPGYSFYCQCQAGWTGDICDADINECDNSPCQNSGLCLNVPGTYTCACLFGFTGKDCDQAVVACGENPCYNNAMCLVENDEPTCYCVPDYHGQLCEMKYNDCESKYAKCDNGGTCIDGVNNFTCSCPPPFGGSNCRDVIITTTTATTTSTTTTTINPNDVSTTTTTISPRKTTDVQTNQTPLPSSTETTSLFDKSTTDLKIYTTNETINSTDNQKTDIDDDKLIKITTSFTTINKDSKTIDSTERSTSVFQHFDNTSGTTESFTITSPRISDGTLNGTVTSNLLASSSATTDTGATTSTVTRTQEEETTFFSEETETTITSLPRSYLDESSTTAKSIISLSTLSEINTVGFDTPVTMEPVTIIDNLTTTIRPLLSTTFVADYSTISPDKSPKNCSINSNGINQCNCTSSDCRDQSIKIAAFNGKSYIRQQINLDNTGLLKIYIKLKTKSKTGIILHAYFDEERYVLLYMEFGQLKFQFSCGLQTMLLGEIDTPINNGNDVKIEIKFNYLTIDKVGKCTAQLFVNETMAMSGEQMLTSHEAIPHEVRLHLGGIPQGFTHYFPRIALGFIGCMSQLIINENERSFIYDSLETFQIDECTSFMCLLNPCRNFGSCHEIDGKIQCKCIAGYTGDMCEKTACDDNPCYQGSSCISSPGTGFICVCPIGMHGLRCEEAAIIVQPSFSVFIPGFSSYAAYGINSDIKNEMEINMRILPQSIDQISLIAFMGQSRTSRDITDHFSVTYVRGYIMLTWDLGSGVRRIFTPSPLSVRAHRAHNLRVGRRGREAWLSVDGLINVTGQAVGTMTQLDVAPILYIGGHKSKNFETLPHDLPLHTGFTGCIFDVEMRMDNSVVSLTKSSPVTGRGVGECQRNECTHNSCKNGAVCLNHGPTYSCICMKEWEGPECNTPSIRCSTSNPSCHGPHI